MQYRREIDGLRALAVVPVIFFHAGISTFHGGFVGVDVFFVISGYLITSIILADYEAEKFSLIHFYERRARRILPALFLVMATSIPFALVLLLPGHLKDFASSVQFAAVSASNFLFYRQSGYFDTEAELKPLLHTWSLAVEEQFYILFPLFVMIGLAYFRKRLVVVLGLIAVASLAYAQYRVFRNPSATFFLLPTRAWELGLGVLSAFYLQGKRSEYLYNDTKPTLAMQAGGLIGLALIAVSVFTFHSEMPVPGLYSLVPTVGTVLIILAVTPQTWVGRLLGTTPLVGLGLISYGAYLWHQPIFSFTRHALPRPPSDLVLVLLSLLALVLAFISWKLVEGPFRQKQTISRRGIFLFSVGCVLAAFAFNFVVQRYDGFAARYPEHDRELVALDQRTTNRYVGRRFNEAQLAEFFQPGKKKVLIIGDSHAQDMANVIYESGLDAEIQISTFMIRARCGNLFLDTDFTANIEEAYRPSCRASGWYENERLKARIREADSVWLVSSWRQWQADLFAQSYANLEKAYGPKFIVFGRKHVGKFNINYLLAIPSAERGNYRNSLDPSHHKINQLIQSSVPSDKFVDLLRLLCGGADACAPFTNEGRLISQDSSHLTAEGARYLGEKLRQDPVIAGFLKKNN
jgi:peptidoglycan/LPS O-acetylase OafA/YrhL